MLDVVPLGEAELPELGALSLRPSVVRFGDHLPTQRLGRDWLGPADPHRVLTLGVRAGPTLIAAAKLAISTNRRRAHSARLSLLASYDDDIDPALDVLLSSAIAACDRWLSVTRIDLRCPADHPRVAGLFKQHGFVSEVRRRSSLVTDGELVDEVAMARLREGLVSPPSLPNPPEAPPRSTPAVVTLRPQSLDDAAATARQLSEEHVIYGTHQVPFQRPELWQGRFESNDPQQIFLLAAEVDHAMVGLGSIAMNPVFRRRHEGSLGMSVAHSFQGRGVGRVLLRGLLELADQLAIERVELGVFVNNERAKRLYESAGFVTEGRCVMAGMQHGALADHFCMARFRS